MSRRQVLHHLRMSSTSSALKSCKASADQVQQSANTSWRCVQTSHEQGWTRADASWLRWLATGTLLVAAQNSPSARADAPEPPKVASGASQQETNNRGGAASTSTSTEPLPDPIGNEHTAKWKVYTTLAKKLVAQKKLGEAEQYLKQALEEAKEGFGADDPHVAGACNNLAELYRLKKDFSKAEALYQECVDKMRQSFGNDDIRVGAALHNMAGLYASTHPPQLGKAEALLTEALTVKKRAVGEKHAEFVQSLVSLAELKRRQDQTEQALLLFKQAAEVLRNQDPSFSASNVLQYTQLASVLVGAGQLGEAEALLHQLLLHVETVKGPDHADVGLICQEMAVVMQRSNRLPEARELLQRYIDIRAAKYRNGQHPGLVDPLLALAAVELKQTDSASWQRAYNIAGRARDIAKANKLPLDREFAPKKTGLTTSVLSFFSSSPPPLQDPKNQTKASLAFLLSSAKMALAMRLMSMAEKNLDRPDEAEQTLYEAIRLFKAAPIKTCLETLYAETDDALESDLGSAVSEHFKMTVVKRVMEAYAACAIQLAQLLQKKSAYQANQAELQPDALLLAAELNHAVTALLDRGGAAHEASMKDVLASKWLPP